MRGDLAIQHLIRYYTAWSADDCFGQCYEISLHVLAELKHQGIDADLVKLTDYKGPDYPNIHPKWLTEDFLNHYVVLIDTLTYDFSARQFDPFAPIPLIDRFDHLKNNWVEIEIESRQWYQNELTFFSPPSNARKVSCVL